MPANGLIGVGPILSIVAVVNAIKSFRIAECSNDLWLWGRRFIASTIFCYGFAGSSK
jgi:hypothetical protein